MNDAEKCRSNGWGPGTRLVGDEGYGPTVIEITAVGRSCILAVGVSRGPVRAIESLWTLGARDWRLVPPTDSAGPDLGDEPDGDIEHAMTTSAEELRAAAATIRQRAEKATPGPWEWDDQGDGCGVFSTSPGDGDAVVFSHYAVDDGVHPDGGNGQHIATWSPPPALTVAAWLEATATWWEFWGIPDPHGWEEKPCPDCAVWHAALAVARAVVPVKEAK